jgi:hypothetical protein
VPEFIQYFDEKKFMWDNVKYPDTAAAQTASEAYEADGFEVRIVEEEEGTFVYSRRVAAEVVVEG